MPVIVGDQLVALLHFSPLFTSMLPVIMCRPLHHTTMLPLEEPPERGDVPLSVMAHLVQVGPHVAALGASEASEGAGPLRGVGGAEEAK